MAHYSSLRMMSGECILVEAGIINLVHAQLFKSTRQCDAIDESIAMDSRESTRRSALAHLAACNISHT